MLFSRPESGGGVFLFCLYAVPDNYNKQKSTNCSLSPGCVDPKEILMQHHMLKHPEPTQPHGNLGTGITQVAVSLCLDREVSVLIRNHFKIYIVLIVVPWGGGGDMGALCRAKYSYGSN